MCLRQGRTPTDPETKALAWQGPGYLEPSVNGLRDARVTQEKPTWHGSSTISRMDLVRARTAVVLNINIARQIHADRPRPLPG